MTTAATRKSEPREENNGRPFPRSSASQADRAEKDREDSLNFARKLSVLLFVGAGILGGFAYLLDRFPPHSSVSVSIALLAALLVLVAATSPFAVIAMERARARHRKLSEEEFDLIDDATANTTNEELGKLISFNFRLMDRFVAVALGQAKAAYVFCALSSSAALFVLLAGAMSVIVADSVTEQVSVTLLSSAGATLSGYISVTFLRTFKITSRHLEYYYGQPLVHCYLLHAEWLADRIGLDDHAASTELQKALVNDTLGAGKRAQDQLSGLLKLHPPARSSNAESPRPGGTARAGD
jgi:hypothetical protein